MAFDPHGHNMEKKDIWQTEIETVYIKTQCVVQQLFTLNKQLKTSTH